MRKESREEIINVTSYPLARVLVKAATTEGKYLLQEIHGLDEGELLIGNYNSVNDAFFFEWGDAGAVLWVGQNCELIDYRQIEFAIAPHNSMFAAAASEKYFADYDEAMEYKAANGGYLYFGVSWVDAKSKDYINPPVWGKTLQSALDRFSKCH